jgi:hypothetical protein
MPYSAQNDYQTSSIDKLKAKVHNGIFGVLTLGTLLLSSNASAVIDESLVVVSHYIDPPNNICIITVNRNPKLTTQIQACNIRTFSWNCLPDDYRLMRAAESYARGMAINIRYSEYQCHYTGNLLLLTVW